MPIIQKKQTEDKAGITNYIPQLYLWFARKLLFHSVTWTAVIGKEKSYIVHLTCSAERHSDTQCPHSEYTRYLYHTQWFFWLGFICCYKTSVKYISCQPLLLGTYYQIMFRNSKFSI